MSGADADAAAGATRETSRAAARASLPVETRHLETPRTARYHLAGVEPAEASHCCFVLHGYGQLAEHALRSFAGAIPPGMCVVAPEALSRFYLEAPARDRSHLRQVGASWLTRDDRDAEIRDAMRWLDAVHDTVLHTASRQDVTTSVIGFSQGVATAMRWIMRGRVRPTHFVAWAGGLATDMDRTDAAEQLRRLSLVLVAGTRDTLASPEDVGTLRATLDSDGIPHELITFDGGHRLDADVLAALLPRLGGSTSA